MLSVNITRQVSQPLNTTATLIVQNQPDAQSQETKLVTGYNYVSSLIMVTAVSMRQRNESTSIGLMIETEAGGWVIPLKHIAAAKIQAEVME